MNSQLIYSVLQYKHSPVLDEAINVGVLFFFPSESKKIHFYFTDSTRIKPLYHDFDAKYFNIVLNNIKSNIERYSDDIFASNLLQSDIQQYIGSYILRNDDSSLQFANINSVLNVFTDCNEAIESLSKLLLPSSDKKSNIIKHDEKFIIKKIKTRLFTERPELVSKFEKDVQIETPVGNLKFDYAWQNGSYNLIKPLSYDLHDIHSFQSKTAEYCSYLNWISKYSNKNYRVDLLLAEPQDKQYLDLYQKSVNVIKNIDSNKRVISFDEINNYADETVEYLTSDKY